MERAAVPRPPCEALRAGLPPLRPARLDRWQDLAGRHPAGTVVDAAEPCDRCTWPSTRRWV